MAIASHLKWLREGGDKWNERRKIRHFVPSLRKANLDGANLRDYNLRGAVLAGASLRGALLDGANLMGTDFTSADLTGASLIGIRAEAATFRKAKLAQANLSNSFITQVILVDADLSGADLSHCLLHGTDLTGARTRGTLIRSSEDHYPNSIDLDAPVGVTRQQVAQMLGDTGVQLPNGFDYPANWPTWDATHSKGDEDGQAAVVPTEAFVFLSYSSNDRAIVTRLRTALQSAGITLWWDQNISAGETWRASIRSKLDAAAAVLTIWSSNSTSSKAVTEEASRAQSDGKLVHVRVDDTNLPYGFSETQYLNLQKWDGSADDPEFRRLIQALQDKLHPPTREEIESRLESFAPVAAVVEDGMVTAKDSPVNAKPPVQDSRDLEERLKAQEVLAAKALSALNELDNNLGEAVKFDLEHFIREARSRPASWYILSDSIADIHVHLENEEISWPGSSKNTVERLCRNHEALRPLLQPVQPLSTSPEAPAVPPEISSSSLNARSLAELSEVASEVLNSPDADAVFAEPAARTAGYLTIAIEEARDITAYSEQGESRRIAKIRHAIKALGGFIGTAITQITFGLSGSLLASPDSAQKFLSNLKRLFDYILSLF